MRREAPSFHNLYHALRESLLGNHKTDKIAIALRMNVTGLDYQQVFGKMSLEHFFQVTSLTRLKVPASNRKSLGRLKTGLGREGEKLHTYITPCKRL